MQRLPGFTISLHTEWLMSPVWFRKQNPPLQSGSKDLKSVICSHSIISLYKLLQNSENTANIFLTFKNYVKISLGIFCIMFQMLSTVKKFSIRRKTAY